MRNERRRADEQYFIDDQRAITFKHAFFWFIKRLIIFAILIIYTVIGAYVFEVSIISSSSRLFLTSVSAIGSEY